MVKPRFTMSLQYPNPTEIAGGCGIEDFKAHKSRHCPWLVILGTHSKLLRTFSSQNCGPDGGTQAANDTLQLL